MRRFPGNRGIFDQKKAALEGWTLAVAVAIRPRIDNREASEMKENSPSFGVPPNSVKTSNPDRQHQRHS